MQVFFFKILVYSPKSFNLSVEFRFVTVSEVYEPERDTSSLHVLKTPHKKTDSASFFKILVYSPKSFNLSVEFRFVTVSEV